jgi:hypothetical protein
VNDDEGTKTLFSSWAGEVKRKKRGRGDGGWILCGCVPKGWTGRPGIRHIVCSHPDWLLRFCTGLEPSLMI